jgi:hypothetical protein
MSERLRAAIRWPDQQGIRVQLRGWSERGQLVPRYDPEGNILVLDSPVFRPWPHGINIDATIILDIDADGILASVEVLLPRSRWKAARPLERPAVAGWVSVEITEEARRQKSFDLPILVQTNEDRSCALVYIDRPRDPPQAYALSDRCMVLIEERWLRGFYVELE